MSMLTTAKKLKWLFSLVLIFGGFTIYKLFEVLAVDLANKEFDFSQIMQGLKPGDYVYWLITFDPRFKNKSRELENAIKNGVHFRMLILKADCIFGYIISCPAFLCSNSTTAPDIRRLCCFFCFGFSCFYSIYCVPFLSRYFY